MVYNQKHDEQVQRPVVMKRMAEDLLQEKLYMLITLVQKSDENAFSDFYDLTINRVFGLVFKILGDQSDSEEVVSDVYAQLWQQATNYHPERGSVMGWCLLIARCRALDLYRKRKTFQEIVKELGDQQQELSDSVNGPEKVVRLFQDNNELREALEDLSSVQRQLLCLAFFKGLSHSEIAEAINMPLGSVKSNIRRAIVALQDRIRD